MFTGGISDLSDNQSRKAPGKPFRHGRMALLLGLHDLQTLQCKKYVFVDRKKAFEAHIVKHMYNPSTQKVDTERY